MPVASPPISVGTRDCAGSVVTLAGRCRASGYGESWIAVSLPPPRFKYLTLLRYSNSAVCELSAVCGTSYRLADDHFHAETNSCDICGARHAPVSFAEYSGTAVSRFSAEFAPGERDANERDDGQAIDSTVIARVVAPVKQAETAGTAGAFLARLAPLSRCRLGNSCPYRVRISARVAPSRLGRGLAYSFEIDVVRYNNAQNAGCTDAEAPKDGSCGGLVPFTRTGRLFPGCWLNNRSPR
jgi:hypothetical protein